MGNAAVAGDELENEESVGGGQLRHGGDGDADEMRNDEYRCRLGWAGHGVDDDGQTAVLGQFHNTCHSCTGPSSLSLFLG